jgi:hypothetical protein
MGIPEPKKERVDPPLDEKAEVVRRYAARALG